MIAWRLAGSSRASCVALASPWLSISSSTWRRVRSESAANTWSVDIRRSRRARAPAASPLELAQRPRLDDPDAGPLRLRLQLDLDPAGLDVVGAPPEDEPPGLVDLLDEAAALVVVDADREVAAGSQVDLGVLAERVARAAWLGDRLPRSSGDAGTTRSPSAGIHGPEHSATLWLLVIGHGREPADQ